MMNPTTRIYVFLLGLAVLAFVINLVRTRRLQERYALLWIVAGAAIAVGPLVIPWIDRLAYALGFDYPPALLLMLTSIGLMLILLQLSLNISHNAEHLKVLTQEVGLMRQELDALKTTAPQADVASQVDLDAYGGNRQGTT
jgi:peptidoglycan/LPS O-acetylase OafA/YrhL